MLVVTGEQLRTTYSTAAPAIPLPPNTSPTALWTTARGRPASTSTTASGFAPATCWTFRR